MELQKSIETLHNKIKDTIISSSPLFLSCQLQEDVKLSKMSTN